MQKYIVIHNDGASYLHNFDGVWYTQHQDDPSCWTSKREYAKAYTLAQIEKMRPMLEMFQGEFTTQESK